MKLYILDIKDIDYSLVNEKYTHFLIAKNLIIEKKRTNKLHTLGRLILYHGLKSDFNLNDEEILIKTNKFGKPYVKNQRIYFNISYSHDLVICCISKSQIGVDIEKVQNIDKKFIKYISNKSDLWIQNRSQFQLDNYFFKDWCLKESFVKYIGMGLSYDIRKLDFAINDKVTLFIDNKRIDNMFFKVLNNINGYKIALSMKKDEKVNFIHLKEESFQFFS